MTTHCCDRMDYDLAQRCEQHPDRYDCPDALVNYSARLRQYGLIVHDGSHSVITIEYCPWCGTKLPSSLADEWFDQLDQLGLEPGDPRIPEPLKSDAWWRIKLAPPESLDLPDPGN